jgi:hypothetical protein
VTFSATQTSAWAAKAVGKAFDVDAITDVASATTTDIGAAATSEINITGTTTITSFGTSNAGIVRCGTFAGILTLTHNGTSLILPGAANITTAAGDSFVARSLGSGNWRVLTYQRANGIALVGPLAWVNFAGATGTIASAFNVSSVTRNNAGDHTVNFTTAMPNNNYTVSGTVVAARGSGLTGFYEDLTTARTTSAVRLFTCQNAGTGIDCTIHSVVVFGR